MTFTSAFYNPFEPLTPALLKNIAHEGYRHIILQRFSWPELERNTSFMATVYDNEQAAKYHEMELLPNEGKLLTLPQDASRISDILTSLTFKVFINTFKDQVWKGRILKAYKNNITAFLRSQNFKTKDPVDIELKFEWGRLLAIIRSGERTIRLPAHKLIE